MGKLVGLADFDPAFVVQHTITLEYIILQALLQSCQTLT